MTPSGKKLFKREYSKELITIAKGDLRSAQTLAKDHSGRLENVLFMVQQSVEKSLKAVLIYQQIALPLVHDLGALVALLPENLQVPGGYNLIELNPYASVRRYEEGASPLSKEEIEIALKAAQKVLSWAEALIGN